MSLEKRTLGQQGLEVSALAPENISGPRYNPATISMIDR
jgi:hypothetical protein